MARTEEGRVPGWRGPWDYLDTDYGLPDARCFRYSGPFSVAYPAAGADIDGVTIIMYSPGGKFPNQPGPGGTYYGMVAAAPGTRVQVEAGGSFSNGALLETLSDGRVVARTSGVAILRALEAGTAGQLVWAVFTSGR